jgi:flagellar assembly protein FliH
MNDGWTAWSNILEETMSSDSTETGTREDKTRGELRGVLEAPAAVTTPLSEAIETSKLRVLSAETLREFRDLKTAYDESVQQVAEMRRRAAAEIEARRVAVLEEARQRGRREGYEALTESLSSRATLRRRARRDATELAFEVAERLVGEILDDQRDRVVGMIDQIVREHAGGSDVLELSVHPSDKPMLEEVRGRLSELAGGQQIRLRADEEVDRGGCILRTGGRRIDARIEVRLAAMKAAILDE